MSAGAGTSVPVVVTAIRRDGFDGDVQLALNDAPSGFSLAGGVIPAGHGQVRVTLGVPPAPIAGPVGLSVTGRAVIQGKPVTRVAVPADDMMQAFAYRHLVPTDALRVSVISRGATRAQVRVLSQQPVKIPVSGTATLRVAFPIPKAFEKLAFELDNPPEGLAIRQFRMTDNGAENRVAGGHGQGEGGAARQSHRHRLGRTPAASEPAESAPGCSPPPAARHAARDSV